MFLEVSPSWQGCIKAGTGCTHYKATKQHADSTSGWAAAQGKELLAGFNRLPPTEICNEHETPQQWKCTALTRAEPKNKLHRDTVPSFLREVQPSPCFQLSQALWKMFSWCMKTKKVLPVLSACILQITAPWECVSRLCHTIFCVCYQNAQSNSFY